MPSHANPRLNSSSPRTPHHVPLPKTPRRTTVDLPPRTPLKEAANLPNRTGTPRTPLSRLRPELELAEDITNTSPGNAELLLTPPPTPPVRARSRLGRADLGPQTGEGDEEGEHQQQQGEEDEEEEERSSEEHGDMPALSLSLSTASTHHTHNDLFMGMGSPHLNADHTTPNPNPKHHYASPSSPSDPFRSSVSSPSHPSNSKYPTHRSPSPSHRPHRPTQFNARKASERLRTTSGYVSFASVEGLGAPPDTPLEGDGDEFPGGDGRGRGRGRWLGWFLG
ncbi:hypothetical protein DXG03_002131 [Asterophora parasitica]|uniref:Uncharacterized protein n=1 Tax=Asterophora parasitica TaxID=117018 RepID=A0A9P7G475_9AGAR|nr:hypothetical protein DXG03_002131 [Asterophora parasitica]